MRTLRKIVTELKVLASAKRNRTDLAKYLVRRPALLAAVAGYESALLVSSRADDRLKVVAQLKTSTLVGCVF